MLVRFGFQSSRKIPPLRFSVSLTQVLIVFDGSCKSLEASFLCRQLNGNDDWLENSRTTQVKKYKKRKQMKTSKRIKGNAMITLLHLHEIVERLYFHCSLSVCLFVCLSVCPALLLNKIQAERIYRFRRDFSLNDYLTHWLGP